MISRRGTSNDWLQCREMLSYTPLHTHTVHSHTHPGGRHMEMGPHADSQGNDNTEKRLRWQLPRIFVDYRWKVVRSPWIHTSVTDRQVSCINTENIRHKTFHSFLHFHFKCMLQLYILSYYSTYFVTMAKDAMVPSPWHKQTLVCNTEHFSGIPNKSLTHNIQKDL